MDFARLCQIINVISCAAYVIVPYARPLGHLEMSIAIMQLVKDVHTDSNEMSWQVGRRWIIEESMSDEDVVRTVFAAILMFAEHELRENFTYHGKRVMNPHFKIRAD